jgi:hypothetical protein
LDAARRKPDEYGGILEVGGSLGCGYQRIEIDVSRAARQVVELPEV